MGSNLGEILREKLATQQFMKDTQPKSELPLYKQHPGKIINNVNRATFEQIRNHPATREEVIKALVERGYKESSVGALLSMMVIQRMVVRDADGVLRAAVKEYTPLKSSRTFAREQAMANVKPKTKAKPKAKAVPLRKPKVEEKVEEKVEAQRPVSVSSPAPAPVWSVDDVLNRLSVTQARALLDALKNLFGETK